MSNLFGSKPQRDEGRTLPRGETVGRYTAYLDAQKAVDYLADSKFPVQLVSIVGNELKSVERVTGRLSYPKVALSSAATGAWFGLFVGLALMLFGGGDTYVSLIPSMALGAVFWLLFGVLAYALQRGRRDFTSISQVVATSYDVVVAHEAANDARQLLRQLPMLGQTGHPAPYQGQPPYQGQQQPPYQGQGQGQQQPPYQGQAQPPYQGQPQPGPHPGAPERPAGWANPYGAATGSQPQPQAQPQPAAGSHQAAPPATDGQQSGNVPRGQFPDLPDGRPQYGVRLPPAPAENTDPASAENTGPAKGPAAQGQADSGQDQDGTDTGSAAEGQGGPGKHQ